MPPLGRGSCLLSNPSLVKMYFGVLTALLLSQAVLAIVDPPLDTLQSYENELSSSLERRIEPERPIVPSQRPPFCSSPPRSRTCYVKSHSDLKTDDSPYILQALRDCNHGGHVVFPNGTTYIIGTALDLTFLSHVDLDIQGYIQFTNDTDYWQAHAFKQIFQNATTFFQLGGEDVNVYGGGTLDGNGQVWYDLYASNIYILRPVLFGTIGLHEGTISNLDLVYSPQYYNFVANSTDVIFSDIFITGYSKSKNVAKNTDGWDTYRSSNIQILNSTINNGDGKRQTARRAVIT